MERRLHLPRWVADRFKSQKREEDRVKAQQLEAMRQRAEHPVPIRTSYKPHSYTRKVFDRPTARRRGKRARLARRGKSIHNFRIHR